MDRALEGFFRNILLITTLHGFRRLFPIGNTVEAFVKDMSLSEKKHLEAFVGFIKSDPILHDAIVRKDWLQFARKYNGANQVGYDGRMPDNYDLIQNAQ